MPAPESFLGNEAAVELVSLLLALTCDDRGGLRDVGLAQGMARVSE